MRGGRTADRVSDGRGGCGRVLSKPFAEGRLVETRQATRSTRAVFSGVREQRRSSPTECRRRVAIVCDPLDPVPAVVSRRAARAELRNLRDPRAATATASGLGVHGVRRVTAKAAHRRGHQPRDPPLGRCRIRSAANFSSASILPARIYSGGKFRLPQGPVVSRSRLAMVGLLSGNRVRRVVQSSWAFSPERRRDRKARTTTRSRSKI